jgi:hypothetical protein
LSWLGTGLALLVTLGWLSAVPYLLVGTGVRSPLRLATTDAIHLYVGSAMVVLLVAKVGRVGLRTSVPGVSELVLWQRWLSWSLGVGYAAVVLTGALALVPFSAPVRGDLADAHLIASVWLVVPTTWHVVHHRARAYRRLRRLRPPRWLGLALLVVPLGAVAVLGRATALPTQTGTGAAWAPTGPHVFIDRLALTPDRRELVAGGAGLFVQRPGDARWRRVGPFGDDDPVLGLELPARGPFAVLAGAVDGLWGAARVEGPYERLPFQGTDVHAVAVDFDKTDTMWASSDQGMWRSTDGGHRWQVQSAGLADPGSAWSLAWRGQSLFGSDGRAVYRWTGARWERSSGQYGVVMLDAERGGRLVASSMGDGVRTYDGGVWRSTQGGLPVHNHGAGPAGVHVVSVSFGPGGRAYAGTMEDGVEASVDGGRTWTQSWPRLAADGVAWRVLPVGSQLVAATDRGLLTYRLPAADPARWWWWLAVAGGGVTAAALAVWISRSPTAGPGGTGRRAMLPLRSRPRR